MDGVGIQLALVLLLVILNAAFAGSEMALVSLREGQIKRLEERGSGGRMVARLARDPNRFLATIQIGITLAGFLASATAAVALSEPLVPVLSPVLGDAAGPTAVVLVTIVLTYVTLVFGELAPKRIAMQRAEPWALVIARPLNVVSVVSRPAVWLLGVSTDLVVRLTGGDPTAGREEISEDEFRDMVTTHRGITAAQRTIISGALEITDRMLREVLVPRRDVHMISADARTDDAARMLAQVGHSRAPVVEGDDLDDVIGVVHWSDLVTREALAREVARQPLLLPDSLTVSVALHRMTTERQQLAFVVDEAGSVDGIVSMEDLLEEIVGEIYDETDSDIRTVTRLDDGALLLPGTYPVHDLGDIGIELRDRPPGSYVTVAGLLVAALRHIPQQPGETVTMDGWTAEVTEVSGRAISAVTIRRTAPDPAEEGDDDAPSNADTGAHTHDG
ncbi:hemolysin family protein [Allonocardiopsis opalescens]|uniref:Putative hemolysin n=1 Tax=Allonocardiopsis opalescens TaxID=1144618 RepID=A0A2T0PZ82_9ACTN|nr:hemolysin family protein [Allonocardiopsis opalescens]PRX96832.1 putative hemolysin [Allonocardiopsis opalescens]